MRICRELLSTLGVPLVVDDLYSLDSDSLSHLQPLHALIFLFKWLPSTKGSDGPAHGGSYAPDFTGFFAQQVVNNACATLAVLNALGNVHPAPRTGPELGSLFEFSQALDPQTRGYALTSADWLRAAHNALSPPATVSLEELGLPREKEDAYHFVVYVPKDGRVWELDGLQPYAIDHGPYATSGEGWIKLARYVNIISSNSSLFVHEMGTQNSDRAADIHISRRCPGIQSPGTTR
jgi:ubiquitin carboxyl-terminal hydrolase L5